MPHLCPLESTCGSIHLPVGIKALLAAGDVDPHLQWVAVAVYLREGQNEDAWRAAVQTPPLDSYVPAQQKFAIVFFFFVFFLNHL
jgi:hypothetical protein